MNATHEEPASVLPPDMLYLGVQGIARMLGYSVGYTRDRIVVRPDFPAAIKIGGRGRDRWRASEVQAWMLKHRDMRSRVGRAAEGATR